MDFARKLSRLVGTYTFVAEPEEHGISKGYMVYHLCKKAKKLSVADV